MLPKNVDNAFEICYNIDTKQKEAMMSFDSEIQNIWEAMQKLRRMGLTNSAAYIALNNAMQEISTLEKNIANKQSEKIEYELSDIKNRFEGEDICFGANTPMGEIDEVVSFDGETMDAIVTVKYPDGEKRPAKINIDSDLGGFDVKAF